MTEREREERFNKEVNDAVKAFMLKITVIAAEFRTDPMQLLAEAGVDIISHAAIMDYKFGKHKKGDEE